MLGGAVYAENCFAGFAACYAECYVAGFVVGFVVGFVAGFVAGFVGCYAECYGCVENCFVAEGGRFAFGSWEFRWFLFLMILRRNRLK